MDGNGKGKEEGIYVDSGMGRSNLSNGKVLHGIRRKEKRVRRRPSREKKKKERKKGDRMVKEKRKKKKEGRMVRKEIKKERETRRKKMTKL